MYYSTLTNHQAVDHVATLISNLSHAAASLSEVANDGGLQLLGRCIAASRDANILERCAIGLYVNLFVVLVTIHL